MAARRIVARDAIAAMLERFETFERDEVVTERVETDCKLTAVVEVENGALQTSRASSRSINILIVHSRKSIPTVRGARERQSDGSPMLFRCTSCDRRSWGQRGAVPHLSNAKKSWNLAFLVRAAMAAQRSQQQYPQQRNRMRKIRCTVGECWEGSNKQNL